MPSGRSPRHERSTRRLKSPLSLVLPGRTPMRPLTNTAIRRTLRATPRLHSLEGRCVPATFTVNATTDTGAGSGSAGDLRYCIGKANAASGADAIAFDPTVFGVARTITLTQGTLQIT